jgi:hypothetical protein
MMALLFKILAVFGPTQFGKSSFINFISGGKTMKVGDGSGKSCTYEISSVAFPDRWGFFEGNSELLCFDVPGFHDTGMHLTNSGISKQIKDRLVGLDSRSLDALLVFQSIAESSIALGDTLSRAETSFGPGILQSIIVIITKSDLVAPKAISMRMQTIKELCDRYNIPYVKWVNYPDDMGTEESPGGELKNQITELRNILRSLRPFPIMQIDEYDRLVREKAQRLMDSDPNNVVVNPIPVNIQGVEPYYEEETYTEESAKKKYTDE